VTTKECKVNFYWSGPNTFFRVFAPNKFWDVSYNIPIFTYQGVTSFPINLNVTGTWYVDVVHNITRIENLINVTVRITT
jgi:hypothetical protein